jgi:hypothetical protein
LNISQAKFLMKTLLLFLLCFSWSLVVSAQDVLESNPTAIKWSQINTPHFRIIFPRDFDEQGQRIANTLEFIHAAEAKSLGSSPRRISVILQNQSAVSNGFVSILPRRSEFYAMPSQDYNFTGTNDWLELLASHEYRHIVQYQHALRGFNRALYYVFGATTFAGMSQVSAPDWFWEGDAVATETAFTRSGRGKIPNFSLVFKTNLLEGREFNYHKQYLRSYKHNIPDHYVLGYHMVSYLRKKTNDPDVWGKITARTWSVPFLPFAFSNALKKETGMHVTDLYREMVKELKSEWEADIHALKPTDFTALEVRRHGYTDYLYPQPLENGGVLVMKRGIGDIEQFVALNGHGERKVFTPGFINESGMLSVSGSVVVWNEYGYDPRWSVRNYSLIKGYDLKTKKEYVIGGKHARYGSASLSPDGKKIATVHTGTDYRTEVVILSFPEGQILHSFANSQNDFYSMPRWSDDGNTIVVLKTSKGGRSVVVLDPATDSQKDIIPPGDENIGHPVLVKNFLLYNSPATGIDNIFAIDLSTNTRYQVTSSKYGAYNPSVSRDGQSIYYNEQTRDGLGVATIPFDARQWRSLEAKVPSADMYAHLVEQEGNPDIFKNVPDKEFPVTDYSKLQGLLNPYSWGLFVDNDLSEANFGITSQDILSTTRIEAGYVFNIAERTSAFRAGVSYQGWYPIIDVSGTIAERSVTESFIDQDITFEWNEKTLQAGIRIPLVTTSSRFAGNISIGNSFGLTSVSDFSNSLGNEGRLPEYVGNGNLLFNDFNVDAYRLQKRSRRDINSKWGQRMSLQYLSTPYGGDFDGQLLAATGVLYFPGLFRHHSLWGYGAFQDTRMTDQENIYWFQNAIPIPRGHSVSRFQKFYSTSANYTLPVWYPDIALGPVLNIQRFRVNGFFDYGFGESTIEDLQQVYASVGIEGKVDINILRFLPQLDVGLRYSVGLEPSTTRFEVLIGTFNF